MKGPQPTSKTAVSRIAYADGWDPDRDESEYANLLRYISTYRDRRYSAAVKLGEDDDRRYMSKIMDQFRWRR